MANGATATREEQRAEAREMRARGATFGEIGSRFGISRVTASRWTDPDRAERESAKGRDERAGARAVREQIEQEVAGQLAYDRARPSPQGVLRARMAAFLDAQEAVLAGEIGAREALQGAAVDLASAGVVVAEELAADPGAAIDVEPVPG